MLKHGILLLLISLTLSFSLSASLPNGRNKHEIRVNVLASDSGVAEGIPGNELYTNGFMDVVSGQRISYHSSHPNAEVALIVRARRDAQSVSWKSDTLPSSGSDPFYRLLWLAGLERAGWEPAGIPRIFSLFVNDKLWFTFKNLKDSSALNWTVDGADGATLSFISDMEDRYGDLFGRMVMRLPKRHFPAGSPLTIRVDGENLESGAWYMIFTYSFTFSPAMRAEPAILRSETGEIRPVRISLDNLCRKCSVEVTCTTGETIRESLAVGANNFFIPVEASNQKTDLELIYLRNGRTVQRQNVEVEPVVERYIYILPYSHNDIGYTDLQRNIEQKQWRNLDQALALIEKTRRYPEDARFKWNLEVTWPLESYLNQATADRRRAVADEVRQGNICVNALFANILTGLVSDAEMNHMTQFARKFSRNHSVPITTAVVSDIPGFTWGIVNVLAQSGVKYFSMAPNSGDRVGHIYEGLGDKPFYWVSQSGEEKVLTWLAAASYSTFHEGELSRLGEDKMLKIVRKLDGQSYPFSIVQLPYTIGGDNGPPDPSLPEFVRDWNVKYSTPRLRIATHAEMFRDFERLYGKSLPLISGDFTPYWEDGTASSSYETALNRAASNRLVQGEILWSINSPDKFPGKKYENAWRNVLLYHEHTWGAHNSVSDPDSSFVINQWNVKRRFALDADSLSRALLVQAAGLTDRNEGARTAVDVYNTASRVRSDIVILTSKQSVNGDLVTDGSGDIIPSQRLSTGELAFYAKSVAPLSAKRYFIKKGKPAKEGGARASGNKLENGIFTVTVGSATGAIETIKWKGRELVDQSKLLGVNRYFYVPGKDPALARSVSDVKISVKETGGLMASILMEADAPGCSAYASEIRIYDGLERIDIINLTVKNAVRAKEGVHFAFPFNVPDGEVRYDVAYGIVKPEEDQLPGSCKNFFSVQSFIDASNSDYGVTLIPLDAPLVEMGAINAERPWMESIRPSQCFYSYVMNNYWHTNYKADQSGEVIFRYSIYPHKGPFTHEAAYYGREIMRPLIAVPADPSVDPAGQVFYIQPENIVVSHMTPVAGENAIIVQLYNPTGSERTVEIKLNYPKNNVLSMSNIFQDKLETLNNPIDMPAYSTRYIRIDRK